MNDHDAIDAISKVLDQWFKDDATSYAALSTISRIIGENAIDHMEAKGAK